MNIHLAENIKRIMRTYEWMDSKKIIGVGYSDESTRGEALEDLEEFFDALRQDMEKHLEGKIR